MAGVRQFNEEAVLEKALEVFWRQGYAQTSMPELAAATGVQRGSLYNAYQGKETLFLRAFDIYRDRFLSQLRASLDPLDLQDALTNFFGMVITSMRTGMPTRGCLTTKSAFGVEVLDPPVQEALRSLLDGLEAILLERLAHAGLAMPAEDAARLIVTFTRGLVVIERVYQDEARMRATAAMLTSLLVGQRASGE
jgi:TetR/AcrR family transcriptional repressor of nem operon